MAKLKLSYQRPEELPPLLKALEPFIKSMRYAEKNGLYRRIYIDIKEGYETSVTVETTKDIDLTPG